MDARFKQICCMAVQMNTRSFAFWQEQHSTVHTYIHIYPIIIIPYKIDTPGISSFRHFSAEFSFAHSNSAS
jgi:hypothetical protein